MAMRAAVWLVAAACVACHGRSERGVAATSAAPALVRPDAAVDAGPTRRTLADVPATLDGSDASQLSDWVMTRVLHARAGHPELVRITLSTQGPGWGCRCPNEYLGASQTASNDSFLRIEDPTKILSKNDVEYPTGRQAVVEGEFTGRLWTLDEDEQPKPDVLEPATADPLMPDPPAPEPEEHHWIYRHVPEFRVARLVAASAPRFHSAAERKQMEEGAPVPMPLYDPLDPKRVTFSVLRSE